MEIPGLLRHTHTERSLGLLSPAGARMEAGPPLNSFVHDGTGYAVGRLLGRGGFAAVHEVCAAWPKPVRRAAKILQAAHLSCWARERVIEETQIWAVLEHPHIVRFFGKLVVDSCLVMLIELVEGGELFDRVQQMDKLYQARARASWRRATVETSHALVPPTHLELAHCEARSRPLPAARREQRQSGYVSSAWQSSTCILSG